MTDDTDVTDVMSKIRIWPPAWEVEHISQETIEMMIAYLIIEEIHQD